MALRTGEIYLSWSVRHCLRLLSQASQQGKVGETSDAIADRVLQAWLEQEHPQLWAWVQQRQESEQAMVKELANGKATAGTGTGQQPNRRRKADTAESSAGDSARSSREC